jgi:DNA repair protein RecO (recombination protein O)
MERMVTPALVARVVNYRDADRICTLLTLARGRISVLARSARRSRKRFGGALSLFVIAEATLQTPTRGDLFVLESLESLEDLAPGVSEDVVKMAHGSYMLEAARELWPGGQPEPRCFELLCGALRALATAPPSPPLLRAFELQLLSAMGLEHSLLRCAVCGAPEAPGSERISFDVEQGGVVCSRCGPRGRRLSPAAHEALVTLQHLPLTEAPGLELDPAVARETRDLMLDVMRFQLGKELRSLEFLIQLGGTKRSG